MFILQNYVDQQIARLEAFNLVRLERARSAMHSQAVNVFNVLPALLHFNHPAIPGYLERSVLHGVCNFTLTSDQQDFISDCALAASQPAPSKPFSQDFPIKGLFSMGSTALWDKAYPVIWISGCVFRTG